MTDKPKDKKIVGIRKDVVIQETEEVKHEPIPELVEELKLLYEEAKAGTLRELCYAACDITDTPRFRISGEPYNFTLMSTNLKVLDSMYTDIVVLPIYLGYGYEGGEDFDE